MALENAGVRSKGFDLVGSIVGLMNRKSPTTGMQINLHSSPLSDLLGFTLNVAGDFIKELTGYTDRHDKIRYSELLKHLDNNITNGFDIWIRIIQEIPKSIFI